MGMRKYARQVARERMTALGVGNVNRQMGRVQDGVKNWRRAMTGKTGKAAEQAQMKMGAEIAKERKHRKVVTA